MANKGFIKRIDGLGRVVLPASLRRNIGLKSMDSIKILVDKDSIVLQKYSPGCILCGQITGRIRIFKGKSVCRDCQAELEQAITKVR